MAMTQTKRQLAWLAAGVVFAMLVGIILLNMWPQEKRLQHRLQHVSAVDSVQFRREIGTLLGAMLLGVLNNGLNMLGVSPYVQSVIKGGIILLAIFISRQRHR